MRILKISDGNFTCKEIDGDLKSLQKIETAFTFIFEEDKKH